MKRAVVFGVFLFTMFSTAFAASLAIEPIVTAEKYMEYKRKKGHLNEFTPPKIILVCYQQSTLKYFLEKIPDMKVSDSFSNLYIIEKGRVGILGGWGLGAPALSIKMEELIALGVKKFIAVGTAGTLMKRHSIGDFIIASKALAEDGVAHLYLKGESYAKADVEMLSAWDKFIKQHSLSNFHRAAAWSFSAIFKETPADISRVTKLGMDVVEMETATLYAIGHEKKVQTLSLFVISDSVTQENWIPYLKEPVVRNNLHKLAAWALEFCKETAIEK
ncbi:MAG: hypothetical protein WCP39_05355 [Chlamydiota bacterium]